ncbi:NAD(P)-binding protein [Mollisia scopiformis]|uniref:NAD(P)-binding protein n=1 Tax=Mollisia scopiformis TaxID=149040 RepID=A0A194WSP2_MOLSC|nr:NAD(P)-binding protein [Mollisia scopiformis]KUJ10704.1 NAD(P)-binding protein [Mollisia scopiformis]
MTSQAWQILPLPSVSWRSPEALTHLQLNTSVPTPTAKDLGENQVLIRIKAASINARDVMVIAHDPIYPLTNIPTLSPCADGSGEIIASHPTSTYKPGDRIIMHPLPGYTTSTPPPSLEEMRGRGAGSVQGTLRQYAIVDESELFSVPAHLSYEQAAAIPAAGATALNALLFGPMEMKPGMTILTIGTGGVSCAAIQLASSLSLTVIATSSSPTKLTLAKSLGAIHTLLYTSPTWVADLLALTAGKGVDHVLDVAGDLATSLKCVKQGGLVSLIGFLDQSERGPKSDLVPDILYGGKIVRGVFGFNTEHVARLLEITSEYKLEPLMEVFEWEDAREAFERSMGRSVVGKIVIRV